MILDAILETALKSFLVYYGVNSGCYGLMRLLWFIMGLLWV